MLGESDSATIADKVNLDVLKAEYAASSDELPEIQRMLFKAFNDNTIEKCVNLMAKCTAKCSSWIMQHYDEVWGSCALSMAGKNRDSLLPITEYM